MDTFRAKALKLDAADPLALFRERFVLDEVLYLDGNSLGRLPKATVVRMREVVEEGWGAGLIAGWNADWLAMPQRIGAKIARLVGAEEDEVVVCDSTSVDFYKLAHACVSATERRVVVTNSANFPSDLYLLQGLGAEIRVVDSERDADMAAAVDGETALLTLSHVEFKSGLRHDLGFLTERAHAVGARVLYDLSHSVGAVEIDLGEADLAVGCAYKYLNGGPGAPAFLYVRRDLQDSLRSPIQGWFGARHAFRFGLDYAPASGIDRFLAGTPPILSMAAAEPGVELMLEAEMERIAAKGAMQTSFLIEMADSHLAPLGFETITPREPARRGSHVALRHPEAWRINQALIGEMAVVPDFRSPDVLRLGIAPLYTRYVDLAEAVARIARVVEERSYLAYSSEQPAVT